MKEDGSVPAGLEGRDLRQAEGECHYGVYQDGDETLGLGQGKKILRAYIYFQQLFRSYREYVT